MELTDEEYEQYCAELWADDPDVEITDLPLDRNAKHGSNTPEELDKGDSKSTRLKGHILGALGR